MKAILVIDMPTHCGECPVKCRMRGINHVPSWCPLKPMPEWKIDGEVAFNSTGGIIYDDEVYGLVKEILNESNSSD